ncbi:MAG: hypothetical protein DRJ03_03265 [Chloroflexi bacterium]|nr:MAG: hypothetical protein DRJ03_03265 [Chloroflexota bacterium]
MKIFSGLQARLVIHFVNPDGKGIIDLAPGDNEVEITLETFQKVFADNQAVQGYIKAKQIVLPPPPPVKKKHRKPANDNC